MCLDQSCLTPGETCDNNFDCLQDGWYCEQTIGQCLPLPTGPLCEGDPEFNDIDPLLEWYWPGVDYNGNTYQNVIVAPAVGDVNGDGTPDIVVQVYTGSNGDNTLIAVLDGNGEGSTSSLLCGMEKLLQDGKDYNAANYPKKIRSLVNLSLGVNGRSDALDKAVKDMTDVGYTVVIAAGDMNGNACFFSPYDPTAITVGALTDVPDGANTKTATSNYGECIDVWAPGEAIAGASNTGEYESVIKSGTSVAAAFVTGAR